MYTIRSKHIEASINPIGAELCSLRVHGEEFLWQGDAAIWSGQAPILFPIVGALKDGWMSYQGVRYEMGRHGFARLERFDLVEHLPSGLCLRLRSNESTQRQFPWRFELLVHFCVDEKELQVRYEVLNDDETPMLFTLGSHPAFALNEQALSDYAIAVEQNTPLQRHHLHESGLLDTHAEAHDCVFSLSDSLFDNDALVFRDIQAERVELSCRGEPILAVKTGGAPHLGIWAKPAAPYVCIEPWLATSDFTDSDNRFENKPDLKSLEPGDRYEHGIAIEFPAAVTSS